MNKTVLPRNCHSDRLGAVAVEMALTLGLLIALVFGIIEFGRALMVNQIITNAAREGARRAVIPGATSAQVENRVDQYMKAGSIAKYDRVISVNGSPATVESAPSHARISVRLSVSYSDVSWGPMMFLSSQRSFIAEVDMRKE